MEFAEIKQQYDDRKFLSFPSMEYSSQRVEILHARLRYCYNKVHEQEALELCDYFCNAYLTVGYLQRGLVWGLRGLKTASQFGAPSGDAHLKVGNSYSLLGLYEKAESHFTQSMRIFAQGDEKWLFIRATTRMGANYNVQGCYEKAENILRSSLTMAYGGLDVISGTMADMGIASEIYLEIAAYQTGLFRYTKALAALNSHSEILEKLQEGYVRLHGHEMFNGHDFTWCEMRIGALLWANTRVITMAAKTGIVPAARDSMNLSSLQDVIEQSVIDEAQLKNVLEQLMLAQVKFESALSRATSMNHRSDIEEIMLMLSFVKFDIQHTEDVLCLNSEEEKVPNAGLAMLQSYLELSNEKLFAGTRNYGCSRPSSYCHGCFETREIEESMEVCQDCRVARFCDKDCQARASNIANFRASVKHKHMCPLLREWHQVHKVSCS